MILEVEGLSAVGDRGEEALKDVSLVVRAGEVLGIAGVAGNGQRELAEAVTGMRPLTAGTIRVAGEALATGDPRVGDHGRDRARAGGPAAHGRVAEPQHRVEHRAEVVSHATRPGRSSGSGTSAIAPSR